MLFHVCWYLGVIRLLGWDNYYQVEWEESLGFYLYSQQKYQLNTICHRYVDQCNFNDLTATWKSLVGGNIKVLRSIKLILCYLIFLFKDILQLSSIGWWGLPKDELFRRTWVRFLGGTILGQTWLTSWPNYGLLGPFHYNAKNMHSNLLIYRLETLLKETVFCIRRMVLLHPK